MRIAGFGNRAAGLLGAARMFRRHQADKRHQARRGGEAPGIAEFGGDRQCGEIVDPSETPQALDARAQRLEDE